MATLRKTSTVATVGGHTVTVYRDAEAMEYVCKLVSHGVAKPRADYHTDCKDDARQTAWAMARKAAGAPPSLLVE